MLITLPIMLQSLPIMLKCLPLLIPYEREKLLKDVGTKVIISLHINSEVTSYAPVTGISVDA